MKATKSRFFVLFLLFIVTAINYMDRANLSVAGTSIQGEFALSPTQLGLLFSMFTWTYVLSQIPVGYILDRIGVRKLYGVAVIIWSIFTCLMGLASSSLFTTAASSFAFLLLCRALIGVAEAPSFPANAKIISTWFPTQERASSTAVYACAQYLGLALLTPVLAFIVAHYGWEASFYVSGGVGIIFGIYWLIKYRDPLESSTVNQAELDHIRKGGGLGQNKSVKEKVEWRDINHVLKQRNIWGLFIAQFAMNSTLYFFLTWFIVYLEKGLNLSISKAGLGASFPYIMAMVGLLCSGFLSDALMRKGLSRTFSRKLPAILGLGLAGTMCLVNFFEDRPIIAIAILSFAFFANAVSNIGWVIISDIVPTKVVGTIGGFFNVSGNLAGIATPIIMGVILQTTGSFAYSMYYISAVSVMGALSHIFIIQKLDTIKLPSETRS
ncbi:MFS transporter [Zophobihabitans entericus]|uniref:MFS transporter n=1 Tax=Zophobihabitans entericus TaxID=1635327 RepID=A0A6G9I9N2_9GAMM|nr:MFS transporter [Zophobihabitans entericus]QIQ20539.1 MFS transporter [Zophobihabitans entericus]